MNLGNLYNKSKELISKGYNEVKGKIVDYKNASDSFNTLKETCQTIESDGTTKLII